MKTLKWPHSQAPVTAILCFESLLRVLYPMKTDFLIQLFLEHFHWLSVHVNKFWSKMAGETVCEVPEGHSKVKLNLDRLREIVKRYIDKVRRIEKHSYPLVSIAVVPECFWQLCQLMRWWLPPYRSSSFPFVLPDFNFIFWHRHKQFKIVVVECETFLLI